MDNYTITLTVLTASLSALANMPLPPSGLQTTNIAASQTYFVSQLVGHQPIGSLTVQPVQRGTN